MDTHMHECDITEDKYFFNALQFLWDFSFREIFVKGPIC